MDDTNLQCLFVFCNGAQTINSSLILITVINIQVIFNHLQQYIKRYKLASVPYKSYWLSMLNSVMVSGHQQEHF